jgi:hypothetical protein
MKLPELASNIGKRGKWVHPPDNFVVHYRIADEVRVVQSNLPGSKILCLQRIEFLDGRRPGDPATEIRLGYYIIGKKPTVRGRWVWGQYATSMPLRDFRALVRKAKKKGWL